MENIEAQKLSYYKFITIIGLVLFVSFSFFYYSPISELEQNIKDLSMQIEINNAEIDDTNSNSIKITLIKSNLAQIEALSDKSKNLMIYRLVAVLFILAGLAGMAWGLHNYKNTIFPPAPKKEKEGKE